MFNLKLKIEPERLPSYHFKRDGEHDAQEVPLTQQEKEYLDNTYHVQAQNFQNNRGRA
jgi:hypothetical protein